MADQTESATFETILPYQLKAFRQRQFEALAGARAVVAPPPAPMARFFRCDSESVRAGIRHMATGRMTVTHLRLKTVMAMLKARALSGRGLLADPRLEAVVVDGERAIFAGFWP